MPEITAPATRAIRVPAGHPSTQGAWQVVSRFLIRSAGFPFDTTTAGADRVGPVLARRAELRAEAAALRGQWPGRFDAAVRRLERDHAQRPAFKALYRTQREVERYRPVPPAAVAHLDPGWVHAWQRCLATLEAVERALDDAAAAAAEEGRDRLRGLLGQGRFVAALTASNPGLAERLQRSLAADPTGRRSSTRQDERVVYAYAQRFATKNETISFYGPIDYGTFGGTGPVRLRYADRPVRQRWVRLSHWAVQLLADAIAGDPAVAGHLPLRLRDGCAVTGHRRLLIATTGREVALSPAQAGVLELVIAGPTSTEMLAPRPAAAAAAADLLSRRVLTRQPLVPTALDDPARWLLGLLGELRQAGVTAATAWHDLLRTLTEGAQTMAGQDGPQRRTALGTLESAFTGATGQPARRGAGAHYADRLLVTEDCSGGVAECVLPEWQARALVRRLSPTLLLCASYSVLLQEAVLARALPLHARLARRGPVGYLQLIAELDRALSVEDAAGDPTVTGWLDELDRTVRATTTGGVATVHPAALASLLREPPAGLVVSPDVFCCADPSEVDLEHTGVVIGEIHHGAQVWSHLSVLDPELDATGREVAAVTSAGGELATLVCRRTQGKAFERELPGPVVPFRAAPARGTSTVLPPERLTVREVAGTLRLTAPDGTGVRLRARHPRSPGNWLFGPPPVVAPTPLRSATHAPRVLVGDVVAWRERWRLGHHELRGLTGAHRPTDLVRAAAELRAVTGLPRLVFARAQGARKPVFADLHCPTSLQHLVHHLRGSASAGLTEMVPEPGQWWLRPAGQPVSCEWRLTLGWVPAPDTTCGARSDA